MNRLHPSIAVLCVFFIYILAHSAYLEPYIRTLHVFQALIYVVIILLLLKCPKIGYFAGIAIGSFWLLMAGRGSSFIANGFQEWREFLSTGRVQRVVTFLAAPAAVDQAGLVLLCLYAYSRLDLRKRLDALLFPVVAAATIGYFVAIIAIFNPQYLGALKRILPGH